MARVSIDILLRVVVFAWLIGFGAAAAYLAVQYRRNPAWWAILGAIIGPLALLILRRAPPGRCASCGERTRGWSTECPWCGEDVRAAPARRLPSPESEQEAEAEPEPDVSAPTPLTIIQGKRTSPAHRGEMEPDTAAHAALSSPAPTAAAATAGRVRRPRRAQGTPGATGSTPRKTGPELVPPPAQPPVEAREVLLASAIYVTGTRGLQAGSRYGIALIGTNLGILGPVDVDPSAIVVLRALRGMDATGDGGQLIITADEGFRSRFAMVFMSLAGGTPERVAEIIAAAASSDAIASR
ncbi:MAG: hypothetical protein ACJ765_13970 [Chloroflexota bacterium]